MPDTFDQPSGAPATTRVAADPADQIVRRHHRVVVGGTHVRYTTTTGRLVLRRERLGTGERDGRWEGAAPTAEIFFVAYTRDGVDDPASRPVTFSFNGGPGSSSVWLHLGLLGPRRVALDRDPEPTPPPFRLVDNDRSLLDATDLVFIDPVSTGYSRAVPGEKPGAFHGLRPDVEAVGDFVRLWTTRERRWASPAYVIGESYGTTRAAALARYLQERHALYPSGLMLVSTVLDFATVRFEVGNDLPPLLYLPTYTAIAHYHGRLAADLQERPLGDLLGEVEAWAVDRYAPFLLRGDRADERERREVAERLARYTGLSERFVERAGHRIEIGRFCAEVLRDRGRTVGRLDGRYLGTDRDAAGERPERDPSYSAILGAYGATFNDYVRRELGFESDLAYEVLAPLYERWSYADHQNRFVHTGDDLRVAMQSNPHLRVHVASGLYDLATPYFAAEHTLAHLGADPGLRPRVATSTYEAGHMMYVHEPSLDALTGALRAFVRTDAGRPQP